MQRTDARHAPQRGAGAGEALADAKNHASEAEQRQADDRRRRKPGRQQIAEAAEQHAEQPQHHNALRPPDIGVAPGVRAAQQRRHILQADHDARPEGAVAELVMHQARQHRQLQADGEVAGEVIDNDGNNQQGQSNTPVSRFRCRLIWHEKVRSWLIKFLQAGDLTIRFFAVHASARIFRVEFSDLRSAFTAESDG